jgi:Raf kinase inhibitor-like YbhB/YbcL family protein
MEILFMIMSTAFADGEMIPSLYTADGQDISPPLSWTMCPGAETYAIICEDPDAPVGNWVHWVIYEIPGTVNSLDQGIPSEDVLECCAVQGVNSWGRIGYGGPAPPSGTHRYFFRLYALDGSLGLGPGATEAEVRMAMEGHVLDTAELMGTYSRD